MAPIQEKKEFKEGDGDFFVLGQLAGNPACSPEERKMIFGFVTANIEKQNEFQDRKLKIKEGEAAAAKENRRKAEEKAKAADIAMKRYSELMQRIVTLNLHLSHHYGRPGPSGQSVGKLLKEKEECQRKHWN